METDKQISILTDCFDLLVVAPYLKSDNQRKELIQNIIITLDSYPQTDNMPAGLAAFLYVSMAENAAKLAQIGYMLLDKAISLIDNCLEMALSLLTDKVQL